MLLRVYFGPEKRLYWYQIQILYFEEQFTLFMEMRLPAILISNH